MDWRRPTRAQRQLALSLLLAVAASFGLYAYGALAGDGIAYAYLLWNLVLAAIPLGLGLALVRSLKRKRWSAWTPIGWTLAWLLFLPNSFYMVTDYIHLREVPADRVLYNAVLFTDFILLALLLGLASLALVHDQLRRRLTTAAAAAWIGGILFCCSFAIYIGRDLRWNSWDVIFNPAGLLFDVSDRLVKPAAYPTMLMTVISFTVFLSTMYALIWSLGKLLRSQVNS